MSDGIQAAAADLRAQDSQQKGTGGPATTGQTGQSANMSQAIDWIHRDMKEKETMKRATENGLLYIDVSKAPINPDMLKMLTKEEAQKTKMLPFFRMGNHIRVAIVDQNSPDAKVFLDKWTAEKLELELNICTAESLNDALHLYDVQQQTIKKDIVTEVSEKDISSFDKEITLLSDLKQKVETVTSEEGLNMIEVGSIKTGASDMHFEPYENTGRVRFRIDGELRKVFDIDKKIYTNIINQLKFKCKMKMNISNIPQDGRYAFVINGRKIDVRVSAIPTQYGESFVCRLLDSGKSFLSFAEMGFQGKYLETMDKLETLSHGMILVTGPTGSGKTTTLYALLGRFNEPESKVITLEDPIEYHVEGISQSQIDEGHGYTFAGGLRTILRQDPDVVMLGEIRDLETAQVAAQAALTGHVMLSTLHTNSAIESIPRLVNMGLPEFIVAPSLHTIIAQRLVRRLCVCAEKTPLTEEEKAKYTKDLEAIKAVIPDLAVTVPAELPKAKGCATCSNTGYRSRLIISEIVSIDAELQELILAHASAPKLFEAARKKGLITMQEDGILKVLQGLTTTDEVFSATNVAV